MIDMPGRVIGRTSTLCNLDPAVRNSMIADTKDMSTRLRDRSPAQRPGDTDQPNAVLEVSSVANIAIMSATETNRSAKCVTTVPAETLKARIAILRRLPRPTQCFSSRGETSAGAEHRIIYGTFEGRIDSDEN
jgi:hypothetical protein